MPTPQNFLDNVENLRIVMSIALEHVQDNRDQFAKSATGVQVRQVEKAIHKIRVLVTQLEKDLSFWSTRLPRADPLTLQHRQLPSSKGYAGVVRFELRVLFASHP